MLSSLPASFAAVVHGASRGIGLALVERLLATSSVEHVIATARNPDSEPLAALAERSGDRLRRLPMDVTSAGAVAQAAARLREQAVRPHLVLNVVGLLHDADRVQPEKRLEDLDAEVLQRVYAVNTIGPALVLRHFLPLMANDGKAVFAALSARVGSISDNRLGGWYAYRSSKAALNQLMKTASIEARRRYRNVVLASLHPGTTDTDLSAPFQSNVPAEKLFDAHFVAERLLAVIDGLNTEDSGGFFAWDGQAVPY